MRKSSILTFTLMNIFTSGTSPWRIVVKRQTPFTIRSISKMTTLTNSGPFTIWSRTLHTFAGMTITFTTSTNGNISNCIKVRLQYLSITEQFVTKRVKSVQ